jgi:hypothetical protein
MSLLFMLILCSITLIFFPPQRRRVMRVNQTRLRQHNIQLLNIFEAI